METQCAIFNTTYNPSAFRTGNSVLRQRLRGPAMAAYYPRRVVRFQDLQKAYPGFETFDDDEEDRVEHVQISKSRGKGAPKKKRTAAGECLRKRRWERMRKRRKARLRKTNRWIVRGHGDEQEDQEEGDVPENRMLTFQSKKFGKKKR
ncbi:hypothetical protein D6C83_08924 [Aureobasidium pullulans]|uniref:Small ribosomal subunit protein mS33 n=1 Tax=Aureobasidium pullulans TaxID=5580 RepID=A0A4S9Z7X6_AURPU|nr:hypothetical protein D6C83_08924 [Aureobasidium pullulans]